MKVIHYSGSTYEYWSVTDAEFNIRVISDEIEKWCYDNLGQKCLTVPEKGCQGWYKYRETIILNRREDLTLFLLRWDY